MGTRSSTSYLRVSDEVAAALAADQPVVALESTLLAHGLPWPQNLEVGVASEATVRTAGAIPATVAVLGGKLCVGLSGDELERVARGPLSKAAAADLGPLLACGGDGATTVSATMIAAARAGVRLFATGGIGGVHRGDALDVSNDLLTLASQPVAVVSAGAKAILDLPRTLEYLETLGVPVVGYRTHDFPGFYTPTSGLRVAHRVDSPAAAAALFAAHLLVHPTCGLLLVNPIPVADAMDADLIERAIDAALQAAATANVSGKQLTPFLLARIAESTAHESLRSNRALVLHNVRVAAEIAVALSVHWKSSAARRRLTNRLLTRRLTRRLVRRLTRRLAPRLTAQRVPQTMPADRPKRLLTVAAHDPRELGRFLQVRLDLQPAAAQRLLAEGAVFIGLKRAQLPTPPLAPGARVTVYFAAAPGPVKAPKPPGLNIARSDEDVLVVDKPAGLDAQPGRRGGPSLVALLPPHTALLHRLDAEASGLLLCARSSAAAVELQQALNRGEITREYAAVVAGLPPKAGRIDLRIGAGAQRGPMSARRQCYPVDSPHGEPATTLFQVAGRTGRGPEAPTLLLVQLRSGRTHQIRVHLAALGYPILGDVAYGGPPAPRLLLHAVRLRFRHPRTGELCQVVSPPPPEFGWPPPLTVSALPAAPAELEVPDGKKPRRPLSKVAAELARALDAAFGEPAALAPPPATAP